MSERKVLTKYYPPDFDPSALKRKRGPKDTGPKVQTVRLMAPFSMMCLSCGEFIYKGRKFNARKETPPDLRYLAIQIYKFYIRCTRCSAEIIFQTDPKNNNYSMVTGAKRNVEPWARGEEESDEARLDRLEQEEAEYEAEMNGEINGEKNVMVELEAKTMDARREMDVADALDEIRTRNAARQRRDADGGGLDVVATLAREGDEERRRIEEEDAEAARRAFAAARGEDDEDVEGDDTPGASAKTAALPEAANDTEATSSVAATTTSASGSTDMPPPPLPSFKRQAKKKTDRSTLLGIKKTPAVGAAGKPAMGALLGGDYGSDSD